MTLRLRPVTAALIAALALAPAAPALAWGEKEQNALAAVAVLGTLGALYYRSQMAPAPAPAPVTVPRQPPQFVSQPASIYQTPVAQAFNRYSFGERQRIQSRLSNWGYYRGGIDGAFGPATYAAVNAYARDGNQQNRLTSTTGAFALMDGLLF